MAARSSQRAESADPAPETDEAPVPGGEVPPEPPEAQPPAGVTLDEPELAAVIDLDADTVEATEAEVAALLAAVELDPIADPDVVSAPRVVEAWRPFLGAAVHYVTARADVEAFGPNSAPGDVLPALVVGIPEPGYLDVRVFIRAEGVPYRGSVELILDPGDVTLDHQGRCFRPAAIH